MEMFDTKSRNMSKINWEFGVKLKLENKEIQRSMLWAYPQIRFSWKDRWSQRFLVIEFWNYWAALLAMMIIEQTIMVVVHKWFCLTPDSAEYIHGRNMMITKKPGLTFDHVWLLWWCFLCWANCLEVCHSGLSDAVATLWEKRHQWALCPTLAITDGVRMF
jgi:hypothetical protein